jgi:hypothetical protein
MAMRREETAMGDRRKLETKERREMWNGKRRRSENGDQEE